MSDTNFGDFEKPTPPPTPQESLAQKNAGYLDNPNVRAFLDLVSWSEGTTQNGYNTVYGGNGNHRVEDLSKYTGDASRRSSAAGRYQLMLKQWKAIGQGKLGLTDFSPRSQDLIAIEQMREERILDAVANGDVKSAIGGASRIWASIPQGPGSDNHSRYFLKNGKRQPSRDYDDMISMFNKY